MKYLVFNKGIDYGRGQMSNLSFDEKGLGLEETASGAPGVFLSRTLDSGEKNTVWHRMVMMSEIGDNMAVYVYLFATDSLQQVRRAEKLQKEASASVKEQMEALAGIEKQMFRNPKDVLLHQIQGRFLWLGMILWGNGESGPHIHSIRLDFPKETWNRFLPEVYQGKHQEFLEQYLEIFQSLYRDMEYHIQTDTRYLDIQAADSKMLLWLAGWIHAENIRLWPPKRLRQYLYHEDTAFSGRGTARSLLRTVEIFTGEKPYLTEAKKGENPNCFSIMLKEKVIARQGDFQAVNRIIREGKPADMEVILIPLKPYLILDQHTYLGINSQLNGYGEAVLNQDSALSFVGLGGKA